MMGQPPLHRIIANCSLRGITILVVGILLFSFPLAGQQSYVTRFDVYGGYAFLDSPAVSLFEHGFASQVGFRPKTWLSFGFDYTYAAGDLNGQDRPVASRVAGAVAGRDRGRHQGRRAPAPTILMAA